MIYDIVYKFYETYDITKYVTTRDVINDLTKHIKSYYPTDKHVVVITKHKFGAWWLETVITDSSVNHFNDYDHWSEGKTEAECEAIIKALG